LLFIGLLLWIVPDFFRFYVTDAVWSASDGAACRVQGTGACWAFVERKLDYFRYGSYPELQRWRVDLTLIIGAVLAACLVLIPSVGSITRLGRPVVQEQTVAELEALRALIPEPRTTLVSARHGLQWWAGYVLFTPVRDQNLPEDAFTKYSRVLMIEETGQGVGSGPPGGPSGGGRRDGGRSELRAGRRDGGGGPPGGMGGPGGRVSIPEGAKKIFEGETLRVWELVAPTVGAPANRAGPGAPGA
jgi:hypothetical protein